MDIQQTNIGQNFYFIDRINKTEGAIVEYGTLRSMLPKYNFRDAFGSNFKRESNFLFSVLTDTKEEVSKAITNENVVFENLCDVIKYCQSCKVGILFGYSVVAKGNK